MHTNITKYKNTTLALPAWLSDSASTYELGDHGFIPTQDCGLDSQGGVYGMQLINYFLSF